MFCRYLLLIFRYSVLWVITVNVRFGNVSLTRIGFAFGIVGR